MMNSTAHSGEMFGGTSMSMAPEMQSLLEWKAVIDQEASTLKNLHFNVLAFTTIPPDCIVLLGAYETACLSTDTQLNLQLKLTLQNWQDTENDG